MININGLLDRLCYRYPSTLVDAITEHELGSALAVLRPPARVIVGGSSTAVTRLESRLGGIGPLRIIARKRNRGHSVLEAGP